MGEGFEEYRRLREQGYSKEEATRKSVSKIPLAILSNKADDYIGKNSGIDEVLYASSSTKRKVDSSKKKNYNGIELDKEANNVRGKERRISTADSKVQVWIVPTNEELAIARETVALI